MSSWNSESTYAGISENGGGQRQNNNDGKTYKNQRKFETNNQQWRNNNGGFNKKEQFNNEFREKNARNQQHYTNKHQPDNTNRNRTENRGQIIQIDTSKLDQRELLIHELSLNKYECIICINAIKGEAAVWSCRKCFNIFHLHCLIKWAKSVDKQPGTIPERNCWRCPTCQNENEDINTVKLFYTCFCRKTMNPLFKKTLTPHSCGDVCGQRSQTDGRCPHLCSLQCHPGPCAPCEASITRQCHCKRTAITAKCNADDSRFHCQSICGDTLQCGIHKCEKQCHVDDGHVCAITVEQRCWCDCSRRQVQCGSPESTVEKFECGQICGKWKECGNHKCELLCHKGQCRDCEDIPEKVKNCCCGKVPIDKISKPRQTCLDPLPTCRNTCTKKYAKCDHACTQPCHAGECSPCQGTSKVKCRCRSAMYTVNCASNDTTLCKQRCNTKLSCKRHRCEKICCDAQVHACGQNCGKMLTCKEHRCDQACGHSNLCQPCPNVSFDELFCECRQTYILPPIACGQKPPLCKSSCSRAHACDHQVRHNCHTKSSCPPCTELTSKRCPCGNTEFFDVPCFRPVVTCGLTCKKQLNSCVHSCQRICHNGDCFQDKEPCKQPCRVLRPDCGHICAAPCHVHDDAEVMDACTHVINVSCSCQLRQSSYQCCRIRSFMNSDSLLKSQNLYRSPDNSNLVLNCDSSCRNATTLSDNFQKMFISRNDKSTEQMPLDTSLSCIIKCGTTCHSARPSPGISERSCNYTAYQCVQRYYATFYEEFARFNLQFVISVEKVFRDFYQKILNNKNEQYEHIFYTVSPEKAQFIKRFSSVYKLICLCARNGDRGVNIIIKTDANNYCYPSYILSKKVEEKYFKMSK